MRVTAISADITITIGHSLKPSLDQRISNHSLATVSFGFLHMLKRFWGFIKIYNQYLNILEGVVFGLCKTENTKAKEWIKQCVYLLYHKKLTLAWPSHYYLQQCSVVVLFKGDVIIIPSALVHPKCLYISSPILLFVWFGEVYIIQSHASQTYISQSQWWFSLSSNPFLL